VAVITLTTDFGTRDTYVAEMKGVILSIFRDVQLVDITHEVTPHDVLEGALALEAAAPRFPATTIHVAVVDPGVGTARRGLAVASRDQIFVAIGPLGAGVTVRVAGRSLPLVRTYGDLRHRGLGALVGSSNRLEIAVNTGSAARALGVGRGARVVVSRTSSSDRRARRRT